MLTTRLPPLAAPFQAGAIPNGRSGLPHPQGRDLIDRRIFEMSAALAMEVGKNRMEALGDVGETADCSAIPATRWKPTTALSVN